MKDVYSQWPLYNHILRYTRPILEEKYGYNRLLQNTMEREEVFSRSLGLSSDIVSKEMYQLQDKSGNNLVLRPEGTAGAMRFLLQQEDLMRDIQKEDVKMWYWGPMYRYERP